MYADLLWSGIRFTAEGGRIADLLQYAADRALQLREVYADDTGFSAVCTAKHYRRLAFAARKYRVHMRIKRRFGLWFRMKRLLLRYGLWAGTAVFGALILLSQQFIWSIDYSGLSLSRRAHAAAILRECGLVEGAYIRADMLTHGETALVEKLNDFGWASLNFIGGRLTVETTPAESVPPIEAGRTTDICARVAATVLAVNVERGTAAVAAGQTVSVGQVLISANRADRTGNPVHGLAAGSVIGSFYWEYDAEQPLSAVEAVPLGEIESSWQILCLGKEFAIPDKNVGAVTENVHLRHGTPTPFGLALPVSYCETETIPAVRQQVTISDSLALAKARLAAERTLTGEWPDADVILTEEKYDIVQGTLCYHVKKLVQADICETA